MGWKIETFKMATYLSFPILVFIGFNEPSFYQDIMRERAKFNEVLEEERDLYIKRGSLSVVGRMDKLEDEIKRIESKVQGPQSNSK